ncbi:arginase family protein [Opitutus sp. ER46]|uniref:arginase family protein n=1 Tax=Opitutus sp. ER46 TaxID=2161864 RepID=UPI001304D1CE|nr:arginase family protein [Opitutus sp. ER46]
MSLIDRRVRFLRFDAVYAEQPELQARYQHRSVDLRRLRGTSLYCSVDAFGVIRRALAEVPGGITLIGSGDHHYVALACISRLERPFTLVVFDRHTDSAEGVIPGLVSCGSWILHAVRALPNLQQVILLGVPEEAGARLPAALRGRVTAFPAKAMPTADQLLALVPTGDVYLSIDKDAFDRTVAVTNWDQGSLTLDGVRPLLRALVRERVIRGVDICGELAASPVELLRADVHEAIRRNERTNEALLDLLLDTARN